MPIYGPLSKRDYETIERITCIPSSEEYLKDHPMEARKLKDTADIAAMGGVVFGTILGHIGGRIIKHIISRVCPPIAMVFSPIADICEKVEKVASATFKFGDLSFGAVESVASIYGGLSAGLLVGNCTSKYKTAKICLSGNYINWKNQAVRNQIYPMFNQFLREQLDEDLLCCLTRDLVSYPVRCPRGHLYEKEIIERWIDDKNEAGIYDERTCPFKSGILTKEMLRYDESYFKDVTFALRLVLRKELCEQVRAGLLSFLDTVAQNKVKAALELQSCLSEDRESGRIDDNQWIRANRQINRLLEEQRN